MTIGIDDVRSLIGTAEQTPSTAPWRIIIIEDVDRMLERTTNVLLKEIEEPSPRTIWLLCAPSAQDVLPTIRSRTRIVNLGVPDDADVAAYLERSCGADRATAARVARLAEGHIGIAALYARDAQVLADRDELVVGVLGLARASQAVLLADSLIASAKAQAQADVDRQAERAQQEFRRVNGLGEDDRVPPSLRGMYNALTKKDELKRQATRRQRDVLDRALNSVASVYRDVAVLQNDAEGSVGLVNVENRKAIVDLSVALRREQVIERLDRIAVARRRLMYNALTKKDELKRQATRRQRDVLDRALNSVASVYRDVAVLHNDAEGSVGLVNVENRKAIVDLSVALRREQAIERLDRIAVARRRLIGNVNPQLVFEALFCELLPQR